jgi:hypothetical protein
LINIGLSPERRRSSEHRMEARLWGRGGTEKQTWSLMVIMTRKTRKLQQEVA